MPEALQENGEKPVILDLYCGVGTIGLYCADEAEQIIGIEIVKDAVLDANRNAVVNGIVNARYICGKAEEILPLYAGQKKDSGRTANLKEDPSVETTESGRSYKPGQYRYFRSTASRLQAGAVRSSVIDLGVERIVYVSCDPATLARDIKFLGEHGIICRKRRLLSMFPHTAEVFGRYGYVRISGWGNLHPDQRLCAGA